MHQLLQGLWWMLQGRPRRTSQNILLLAATPSSFRHLGLRLNNHDHGRAEPHESRLLHRYVETAIYSVGSMLFQGQFCCRGSFPITFHSLCYCRFLGFIPPLWSVTMIWATYYLLCFTCSYCFGCFVFVFQGELLGSYSSSLIRGTTWDLVVDFSNAISYLCLD